MLPLKRSNEEGLQVGNNRMELSKGIGESSIMQG